VKEEPDMTVTNPTEQLTALRAWHAKFREHSSVMRAAEVRARMPAMLAAKMKAAYPVEDASDEERELALLMGLAAVSSATKLPIMFDALEAVIDADAQKATLQ
jgi:hypothetical protein